jgi:hypothetical protein
MCELMCLRYWCSLEHTLELAYLKTCFESMLFGAVFSGQRIYQVLNPREHQRKRPVPLALVLRAVWLIVSTANKLADADLL